MNKTTVSKEEYDAICRAGFEGTLDDFLEYKSKHGMKNKFENKPFNISCNKCGSNNTRLYNMMCYGECEGGCIECLDCGNSAEHSNSYK